MYGIEFSRASRKALTKLPARLAERIEFAIAELAAQPRPPGCVKLSGYDLWRIRVGDYRVIYEIRDNVLIVLVIDIGHRREVYR